MLVVKNLLANAGKAGDAGSIAGWGTSPGGGHGKPLQYSCLENPMDGGAWQVRKESDMTERLQSHFSSNIGVGCHFLLQGIFPTQGQNPCLLHLLHCQADIFLPLSHLGSPSSLLRTEKCHLVLL